MLDAVNWHAISKGKSDAWLYFYEDFLAVYDNTLRKLTGSYYTPPEVVGPMIRLVDDVLRRHFGRTPAWPPRMSPLADPAVGTGTFILGVLRHIAADVEADQGAGAVPQAIESAIGRLIAFEMQLGPFAVAQLRVYAELLQLMGKPPRTVPRMFVTDTLGSPYAEVEALGSWYGKISRIPAAGQRDQAKGTDHRRHRQSAVQGKGEGPRRLDRRGKLVPRLAKSDELVLHPTSHRFKRTRRLSLDF